MDSINDTPLDAEIVDPDDVQALIAQMPDRSKYKPKGIPPQKIIDLKASNPALTNGQIGKLVGCDHSNVSRVLKEYGLSLKEVEKFKESRSDIFAGLQAKILQHQLKEDAIKDMPPSSAALWFNSLFNNERLERGQATNINVSAKLELTEKAYKEHLARQYGIDSGNNGSGDSNDD